MAQEIFWNYKAALNSNEMNRVLLGILQPGRYRGFDSMNVSVLNFDLVHTGTGIKQTKEDLTQTTEKGILYTQQGFSIQEDAAITGLSCQTNAANAFIRTDVVICTHQDVNTIGGQAATYSVIRGANGTSAIPALPNPTYQTIVGYITIPASAANLTSATYTPAQAPLLGGHTLLGGNFPELLNTFAQLGAANSFTKIQKWNAASTPVVVTSGKLVLNDQGNTFVYSTAASPTINEISGVREGTIINVQNDSAFFMLINLNQTPSQGGLKVRAKLDETFLSTTFILLLAGHTHQFVQIDNEWVLIGATNILYSTVQGHGAAITNLQTDMTNIYAENPQRVITKVVDIGDWNMDANETKEVAHGVADYTKIISVEAFIRNDGVNITPGGYSQPLNRYPIGTINGSYQNPNGYIGGVGATVVGLQRLTSGFFDSTSFDATSYNRGWVIIKYLP